MSAHQPTLLVVDDEEFNRDLIGEYLEDMSYVLAYANDGQAAWEMLDTAPGAYDALLLDRMMPRMNGIELLARMKADPRLQSIPVILQTAATSPAQIEEGMRLGAFYYLAKPFPRQALEVAVATALADSQTQRNMREALARTQRILHLLTEAQFSFRTLEEARTLAAELANRAKQPAAVVIGLSEILVNAVEHGNLGITYTDKSQLLQAGLWDAEVEKRLQDPVLGTRRATLDCAFSQDLATLTITDQGMGFDWKSYLEMHPDRAFDLHGRGIALARQLSFTSLEYLGKGNIVRITFPLAV